jgi:hypothetical protein
MRLVTLIFLRILSIVSGFFSLAASVQFAIGVYAVFTVQGDFPAATPKQLGWVHGAFIGAPLFMALLFSALAYGLWCFSKRFLNSVSNQGLQRAPDDGTE